MISRGRSYSFHSNLVREGALNYEYSKSSDINSGKQDGDGSEDKSRKIEENGKHERIRAEENMMKGRREIG